MIWSNWKHIFQSSNTVVCSRHEEATKKIYFACDFSTLTALFPSWFAYKTVSNATCLYCIDKRREYWCKLYFLVSTEAFFFSLLLHRSLGEKWINYNWFHEVTVFVKKISILSWYVLSNYSKNADSWINGWIVSRLLRLLAGIANSFSDNNDSILLCGNYGNQTIIICTMESIIRFIKQSIPYDSFVCWSKRISTYSLENDYFTK